MVVVDRAVVYIRVSKDDEDPENQIYAIKKWARENNVQVVGVFKDIDVSGGIKPRDRPKYRQMLDFMKDNNIDYILFYDLSRFSRSLEEGLIELKNLAEEGVRYKFTAQEFIDYIQDPMLRKKVISDFLWFAELYREDVRRRTIEALKRKKEQGEKLGRPEYKIPVNEVRAMLKKGYKVKDIHRILVAQGKLCRRNKGNGKEKCMSYDRFRRKIKELGLHT